MRRRIDRPAGFALSGDTPPFMASVWLAGSSGERTNLKRL
jgi:hypothetical protein